MFSFNIYIYIYIYISFNVDRYIQFFSNIDRQYTNKNRRNVVYQKWFHRIFINCWANFCLVLYKYILFFRCCRKSKKMFLREVLISWWAIRLLGTQKSLEHSENTWALGGYLGTCALGGHSKGTQPIGNLNHSDSRAFRALGHLGAWTLRALGQSGTWRLRVLSHLGAWALKALGHSSLGHSKDFI